MLLTHDWRGFDLPAHDVEVRKELTKPRDGLWWRWECRTCQDHSGAANTKAAIFRSAERHALGHRLR